MSKLVLKRNEVTNRLMTKVGQFGNMAAVFNRVLYPMYQRAQIERWDTENASEGQKWKRLNPSYKKEKLRVFAAFPYAGRKMGVATGTLLPSVVGGGSSRFHRKMVTKRSMKIYTSVPYAAEFDKVRPFTTFGKKTQEKFRAAVKEFIEK
jgi:diphthamide synthase subunit DPH2